MGTRADFYVGRGPEAEWLGSVSWDGYPSGLSHEHYSKSGKIDIFGAETEESYREQVQQMLDSRDDATQPTTERWPWPWEDSRTTDYAYAFEGGKVYASSFGHTWFEVDLNAENCGEPEEYETAEKVAVFPNMAGRMGSAAHIMAKSGMLVASATPDGGMVVQTGKEFAEGLSED